MAVSAVHLRKISWRRSVSFALALSMGVSLGALEASAESLKEALASAYLFNPTLKAKRAELRSTDEEVPIAKSNFRPVITGNAENSFEDQTTRPDMNGGTNYPKSYSIAVQQPVFRGFRTINAVRGAEALIESRREELRDIEQQVLLDAVTAYMDVVRDESVLRLNLNNQRVLSEQLRAANERFAVGEVTRTDTAQARARLSGAQSQVSVARSNLATSRAGYARIIGNMPSNVRDPGAPDSMIPRSQDAAIRTGEGENPLVLAAIFRERSQEHTVKQIKGELLPEVNLEASYTKGIDPSRNIEESDSTVVTGRVTVPIYQAGQVSARIRQAKETQSQFRQLIDEARELVRANVISAYGLYISARATIGSSSEQVEANRVALAGVREEEKVGQRTLLDVLDAEQELLDSEVTLVTAQRDYVVNAYSLILSIGRLSAGELKLSVLSYDPTQNYRRVKDKWFGWGASIDTQEDPVVAPVTDPGVTPGQQRGDGPAYRQ